MEANTANPPAFRKMRVVGPRQAIALDEVKTQQRDAKAMRDYNPTINAMVEAQSNMKDILKDATSELPSKSRKRKAGGGRHKIGASTSMSLYNACIERLHALKSQFDSSYQPLLQLLMDNNVAQPAAAVAAIAAQAPPAAPPAAGAQPVANPLPAVAQIAMAGTPLRPATIPPPNGGTQNQWMDIPDSLGSLPKVYQERYKELRSYMTKDPYLFKLAPKGQVVFKGEVVPDTSFNDLVRGLYVSARGRKPTPAGMSEFLQALNEVGVPSSLLSAVPIRSQYAGIQAASRLGKASTSSPSSEKPSTSASSTEKKDDDKVDDKKVQVKFLPPKAMRKGRSQTGHGKTVCFPGRPVKCLRLY